MVIARPLENMRLIVETNLLSVGCIMMAGLDTFDSLLRGSGGIYHRSVGIVQQRPGHIACYWLNPRRLGYFHPSA